jgi:hypothetical protein
VRTLFWGVRVQPTSPSRTIDPWSAWCRHGDIGTSPLYTVREILHGSHTFALTETNVYGGVSLVFWALVIVVSLKYGTTDPFVGH